MVVWRSTNALPKYPTYAPDPNFAKLTYCPLARSRRDAQVESLEKRVISMDFHGFRLIVRRVLMFLWFSWVKQTMLRNPSQINHVPNRRSPPPPQMQVNRRRQAIFTFLRFIG